MSGREGGRGALCRQCHRFYKSGRGFIEHACMSEQLRKELGEEDTRSRADLLRAFDMDQRSPGTPQEEPSAVGNPSQLPSVGAPDSGVQTLSSGDEAAQAAAPAEILVNGVLYRMVHAEDDQASERRGGAGQLEGGGLEEEAPPVLLPQRKRRRQQEEEEERMTAEALRRQDEAPGTSALAGYHVDAPTSSGPPQRSRRALDTLPQSPPLLPPVSRGLLPGQTSHRLTKDLGELLKILYYVIATRLVFRGKHIGEVNFRINNRLEPDYLAGLIRDGARMLRLGSKPIVKFDVSFGLILKKETVIGETHYVYFYPSRNTSLIDGRIFILRRGEGPDFIGALLRRKSVFDRLQEKVATKSRESLVSVITMLVRYYYS